MYCMCLESYNEYGMNQLWFSIFHDVLICQNHFIILLPQVPRPLIIQEDDWREEGRRQRVLLRPPGAGEDTLEEPRDECVSLPSSYTYIFIST